MKANNLLKYSTATLYVALYIIVATISCICSVDFFNLTHNDISSIVLAISFEMGSMGCLFGALTTLKKNNSLIWVMFIFLTIMQMMNNTYYAYAHIENYDKWIELFDLIDFEPITQKRIISIISGCVLPLVSLSFIHLLVDLLNQPNNINITEEKNRNEINEIKKDIIIDNKPRVFDAVPIDEIKDKSKINAVKDSLKKATDKLEQYQKQIK